jgi:multicomponent Na+:H+ antiporter subunit B
VTPTEALLSVTLVVALVAAVATALARTLLASLVAFAGYSLALAVTWVVLRAPDVALTEAAVGAGVTTSLFLLVLRRVARGEAAIDVPRRVAPRSVAVAALVAGGLLLTVPALPAVGAPDAPAFGTVTEFYLADAGERGVDNVVTAVLVVYRGFDTFGEIAVVVAAAVAALAVLDREALA